MKDDEENFSDYYECIMIPHNYPKESKTGVTFKGKDDGYFKAHSIIMELIKKKGDRFSINGIEIAIADNPFNKPVSIELKPKVGLTGKVNLKVYAKNGGGGATMMITKPRGGDMVHVKDLAFKVIKYLLDNVISGDIDKDDIELMRKKSVSKSEKKECENKCNVCKKKFKTNKGLKLHMTRVHKTIVACVSCESNFLNDN